MMVPNASESGMLRLGSLTSPAVKVMLFQASAENSEPVWATQIPTKRPNALMAVRPPPKSSSEPLTVHRLLKFAPNAPEREPISKPNTIRPNKAASFAVVKVFWTSLPSFRPRVFMNVNRTIKSTPTSCAVESEIA